MLYTHTFKLTSQDQSTWIEYFRAAELCQSYIATQAVEDSLPYRLQVVIEEYRCEFKRLIKYSNTTVSARKESDNFTFDEVVLPSPDDMTISDPGIPQAYELQPGIEFTDWEQFYPFVSYIT